MCFYLIWLANQRHSWDRNLGLGGNPPHSSNNSKCSFRCAIPRNVYISLVHFDSPIGALGGGREWGLQKIRGCQDSNLQPLGYQLNPSANELLGKKVSTKEKGDRLAYGLVGWLCNTI